MPLITCRLYPCQQVFYLRAHAWSQRLQNRDGSPPNRAMSRRMQNAQHKNKINVSFVVWQHPYVNVFKHFGVGEWKKCSKQGDVTTTMVRIDPKRARFTISTQDKSIKSTVYRIQGSIPASNFIQVRERV